MDMQYNISSRRIWSATNFVADRTNGCAVETDAKKTELAQELTINKKSISFVVESFEVLPIL